MQTGIIAGGTFPEVSTINRGYTQQIFERRDGFYKGKASKTRGFFFLSAPVTGIDYDVALLWGPVECTRDLRRTIMVKKEDREGRDDIVCRLWFEHTVPNRQSPAAALDRN